MVPMELPNKRFPVPPPFMYHPELQPELAANNIKDFKPLEMNPRPKGRNRNPRELKISAVEASAEKRFAMPASVGPKTLKRSPALYMYNKDSYWENIEELQGELDQRAMEVLINDSDMPGNMLGEERFGGARSKDKNA